MTRVTYMEVVKVVDLEPILIEDTGESHYLRIEVQQHSSNSDDYSAKVYKKDRFELQPSLSRNGEPVYDVSSPMILIEDDEGILGSIQGKS